MAFPTELVQLPQWVVWRRETRDGKPTKVPYDARTGRRAATNKPSSWCNFEEAEAGARNGFDGIGFVFTKEAPYCGIDLDECRDPSTGEVAEWARKIVDRFDSYTEVSPSGTGLHLIIRGELPGGGIKRGGVEVYDRGRYFTMTGQEYDRNS